MYLTEMEEYHHNLIIEHNAKLVNNNPVNYPEESNIEKAIRKSQERKAQLEIIRKNEQESNQALKGKKIDYKKIHDYSEQFIHDNNY